MNRRCRFCRLPYPAHSRCCPRRRGLGAPLTGGAATADRIAAAGAAGTVSTLVALGAIGGPVGIAVGALIGIASQIASLFGGCGQTCVQATQYANQTETLWQQNLETYMNAPVHYASLQAAALNNFDTIANALYTACSNPALGSAGQRCISERLVRGSVWDAYAHFRDPIANDPNVVPDPSPVTQAGASVLSALGVNPSQTLFGVPLSNLLLPGGLFLVALLFSSDN